MFDPSHTPLPNPTLSHFNADIARKLPSDSSLSHTTRPHSQSELSQLRSANLPDDNFERFKQAAVDVGARLVEPGNPFVQHSTGTEDSRRLQMKLNMVLDALQSEAALAKRATSVPHQKQNIISAAELPQISKPHRISTHTKNTRQMPADHRCPHCNKSLANYTLAVAARHPTVCASRRVQCLRCNEIISAREAQAHKGQCMRKW